MCIIDNQADGSLLHKLQENYKFCLGVTVPQRTQFYPLLIGSWYDHHQQNLQTQLSSEDIAQALKMAEQWTLRIKQNGTLYPH